MIHLPEKTLQNHTDGLLDNIQLKTADSHLQSCLLCRSRLQQIQTLSSAISTTAIHPAPNGFTKRVMDEIEILHHPVPVTKKSSLFDKFPYLFAAAIIVVVLIAGFTGSGETTNSEFTNTVISKLPQVDVNKGMEYVSETTRSSLKTIFEKSGLAKLDGSLLKLAIMMLLTIGLYQIFELVSKRNKNRNHLMNMMI